METILSENKELEAYKALAGILREFDKELIRLGVGFEPDYSISFRFNPREPKNNYFRLLGSESVSAAASIIGEDRLEKYVTRAYGALNGNVEGEVCVHRTDFFKTYKEFVND